MTALPVESLAYGPNDNLLKAISLFRSEQYSEALDLFYQELAKNPTDTNIMGWIAGTLEMLGQYEDALNIENQILATDLSYSEDLDDKLELLLKMGRYNEALDVSDQQIAMLGGDGFSRPYTIFLRGKTLSLLGRYNEALGFFDSLITDGSWKGESLEQKALIMEKLGQDYEALDFLYQANEKFSYNQEIQQEINDLRNKLGLAPIKFEVDPTIPLNEQTDGRYDSNQIQVSNNDPASGSNSGITCETCCKWLDLGTHDATYEDMWNANQDFCIHCDKCAQYGIYD